MEYAKFLEFLTTGSNVHFQTHLPIQLDATCNGFQHIAMLANEQSLFGDLNLKTKRDASKKDFYEFV